MRAFAIFPAGTLAAYRWAVWTSHMSEAGLFRLKPSDERKPASNNASTRMVIEGRLNAVPISGLCQLKRNQVSGHRGHGKEGQQPCEQLFSE
jgi:hypothetical protein